eukprot:jgi/Psemu1/57826/gm1.57826_g
MCPVEFRKEYANFIKVLRQMYNQLGIEGVEGKITDVLTHDYGDDSSDLIDVWTKNTGSGIGVLLHMMCWSWSVVLNAVRELPRYMQQSSERGYRATEDTEGKSATKVSTSYKTKSSTTNSAKKSKSGITKVGVLVNRKPVHSFQKNEGGQNLEHPTETEPTDSKTPTHETCPTVTEPTGSKMTTTVIRPKLYGNVC